MTETIQLAKKVGGSMMVRIPKKIVEIENIKEGEAVQVDIKKVKKYFFGITPGLSPFNKSEDRMRSKYE
ncbi:MAG TPA: AbrB/MazE/SpoVT family DNA-binding domain-containing protein [Candidatus Nanoarchaeia archaeon]|nr:AbrB/MazE/SpoVT family DNA-binding domain-containing protein [Candidatus Nanoarchaeia archaeon]